MALNEAPKAGTPLSTKDVETILEAIHVRRENFPDEPASLSFMLVLKNIGNRYAPITCFGGEWEGLKSDIPDGEDEPTCPNGHTLMRGPALKIGWIEEEIE